MREHEHPDREFDRRTAALDEQSERELALERLGEVTPAPRSPRPPKPVTSAMVALAWATVYGPWEERESAGHRLAELVLGEG